MGVAISRYFGAGDYDKVSRAVHTAVLLGLISSLILTVIGVLFTPTLLRWMDRYAPATHPARVSGDMVYTNEFVRRAKQRFQT